MQDLRPEQVKADAAVWPNDREAMQIGHLAP